VGALQGGPVFAAGCGCLEFFLFPIAILSRFQRCFASLFLFSERPSAAGQKFGFFTVDCLAH
jgi:hypothetical protein